MKRELAFGLLRRYVSSRDIIKHALAVEAIMRDVAAHFRQDEEKWGLAGLLHDLDYEQTRDDPHRHSLMAAEMLATVGMDSEVVYAIKAHNGIHGLPLTNLMDKVLYAADPLAGLIIAAAMIHPERKLAVIDVTLLLSRYDDGHFARGINREQIASSETWGLSLDQFAGVGLRAMQKVSRELGL